MKRQYFEVPTQVIFRQDAQTMRENGVEWFAGIAYRNEIICGDCGGIIEVDETELIYPVQWMDISVPIKWQFAVKNR